MRFITLLLLISTSTMAQTFDEAWLDLTFNSKEEYKANEQAILQCANYLMSVPMGDFNRQNALNPVAKWMAGTPDHNFLIGPRVMKLNEENEFVISVYMAASAQYALENAAAKPSPEEIEYNAFLRMLTYIENKENNFWITKGLRKALDAKNKGKLKEYLKS